MSNPSTDTADAVTTAASPAPLPSWQLVPADLALLPQIAAMEEECYAPDEMCTPENFRYRLDNAQAYFKAAVTTDGVEPDGVPRVIGFVVGTLSEHAQLHHASMSQHAPAGRYLCIHSVVTSPLLRRRGLARAMLRQYVAAVSEEQRGVLRGMVLICKAHLIGFYQSCGFTLVGPSDVVHGKDPWFECRITLEA